MFHKTYLNKYKRLEAIQSNNEIKLVVDKEIAGKSPNIWIKHFKITDTSRNIRKYFFYILSKVKMKILLTIIYQMQLKHHLQKKK